MPRAVVIQRRKEAPVEKMGEVCKQNRKVGVAEKKWPRSEKLWFGSHN